jgi:hypothetical protein
MEKRARERNKIAKTIDEEQEEPKNKYWAGARTMRLHVVLRQRGLFHGRIHPSR